MVTVQQSAADTRFVLHHVRWQFYQTFLDEIDDGNVRLAYDRGDLTMRSPSWEGVPEIWHCDGTRVSTET